MNACLPFGENDTTRPPLSRRAHFSANTVSRIAAPRPPARCVRRTLQSRQARQTGRRRARQRRDVYAERREERLRLPAEPDHVVVPDEHAFTSKPSSMRTPEIAGKVVVADARLAQRLVARSGPHAQRAAVAATPIIVSSIAAIAAGQREIAMPALHCAAEQAASRQLGQMRARRLQRDAGLRSSVAVSAVPPISAVSMLARAGSPTRAAMWAMSGPSLIVRS